MTPVPLGQPTTARGWWRWALGLALAALALAVLCRTVELVRVGQVLRGAEGGWVLAALATVGLTVLAKALRWRCLLSPSGRPVPLGAVLRVLLVGQALNTLLPARAGDLARVYLIGQVGPARSFALGTLVLEKVLDLLGYALLLAWLVAHTPLPAWVGQPWPPVLLAAVGAASVVLGLAGAERRLRARRAPGWASRWQGAAFRVLASLAVLRQRRDLFTLAGWTLAVWALAVLTNVCVLRALHLQAPPTSAVLVLLLLQVGISLGPAPATLGIFEYTCVLALALVGVDEAAALGFGLLLHSIVLLPSVCGLLALLPSHTRKPLPPLSEKVR